MAREFSKFNLAIWQDDDWRAVPPPAQHLYMVLWAHPGLTYAGVVDWRPGRIAALAGGWTADEVRAAADCLEARLFIVTDEDTEECLIRSWARFDGLMKQPRMAVSFANAYAETASSEIRGVIIHELNKLHTLDPDLAGWAKPQVTDMLGLAQIDPRSRALPEDPFGDGFGHTFGPTQAQTRPDVSPSVSVPPTTATTTSTSRPSTSEADASDQESARDDVQALCEHLSSRLTENDVKHSIGKGWHDAARLLIDRDRRDLDEARRLIDWATSDSFWRTNILSMPKFREKYDQLRLKAQEKGTSNVRPLPSQRPGRAPRMSDFTTEEWLALPVEQRAAIAQRGQM